jgi:hypothetical protein
MGGFEYDTGGSGRCVAWGPRSRSRFKAEFERAMWQTSPDAADKTCRDGTLVEMDVPVRRVLAAVLTAFRHQS